MMTLCFGLRGTDRLSKFARISRSLFVAYLLEANSRVVCLLLQNYYPMFRSVRGRAVIINNKYFLHSSVRQGCDNDVQDLQKLFAALHYEVVLRENRSAQVTSVIRL